MQLAVGPVSSWKSTIFWDQSASIQIQDSGYIRREKENAPSAIRHQNFTTADATRACLTWKYKANLSAASGYHAITRYYHYERREIDSSNFRQGSKVALSATLICHVCMLVDKKVFRTLKPVILAMGIIIVTREAICSKFSYKAPSNEQPNIRPAWV